MSENAVLASRADEFLAFEIVLEPTHVRLVGELDLVSAEFAWTILEPLAVAGRDLVVDLCGLGFIDCSGVAVIERLAARLADGMLHLVNAPAAAHRLLCLTGIARLDNVSLSHLGTAAVAPVADRGP